MKYKIFCYNINVKLYASFLQDLFFLVAKYTIIIFLLPNFFIHIFLINFGFFKKHYRFYFYILKISIIVYRTTKYK